MKRILLDENVRIGLVALLDIAEVAHVHTLGWSGISDTALIEKALGAGFDVLVTTDRNLAFQQNLRGLALVVVDTNNWAIIRRHAADIRRAVAAAQSGAPTTVSISGRGRRRP